MADFKDINEGMQWFEQILNKVFHTSSSGETTASDSSAKDKKDNQNPFATESPGPYVQRAKQYNFDELHGSDKGQGAKEDYSNAYTEDERNEAIGIHKQRQQDVQGNWTQTAKNNVVPWHSQHLGKNDPYGNLNDKSFQSTLNYSRLADRFNNHLDWEPSTVGRTTYHLGSTEGTTGNAYRRQPIETQEMRQMRSNERITDNARMLQTGLQGAMNQYGLDLQRQSDTLQAQFGNQLGIGQDAINRALQQALITGEYVQPNSMEMQQKLQKFLQYLSFEVQTQRGGYMYNIYQQCGPVIAAYAMQAAFGVPGMNFEEVIRSDAIRSAILNSGAKTPEEIAKATKEFSVMYDITNTEAELLSGKDTVTGKTKGLAQPK